AAGQLAGRVVGLVVGGARIGPRVRAVEGIVDMPSAVVVDDGVARRPVEPRGRVVDPVQGTRGDAAYDHVLGDVRRQLAVTDAGRHEGLDAIERVSPALVQPIGTHVRHGVLHRSL